jgi:hypothetical protein
MLLRALPWSSLSRSNCLFLRSDRSVFPDHVRPDLPRPRSFPPARPHVSYSTPSRLLRQATPKRRPHRYPFPPVARKRNRNPSRVNLHPPTRQFVPSTRHLLPPSRLRAHPSFMNGELLSVVLGALPETGPTMASRVPLLVVLSK